LSSDPYRIPSLSEILLTPSNGLTAASTFSGCGGASLGLRWAGFSVPYASEFIDAAADTYEANFPETFVDRRDIREVSGAEIVARTGPVDLLEGSPPCSAFSVAGIRDKGWGEERSYSSTTQRVDDLFGEFLRLASEIEPRAFIAENVAGLARGKARGFLREIVVEGERLGYTMQVWSLDAAFLGVPQRRARLVIVGTRGDKEPPLPPDPKPVVTIREAFAEPSRTDDPTTSYQEESFFFKSMLRVPPGKSLADVTFDKSGHAHHRLSWGEPSPCILQATNSYWPPDEDRSITLGELRRICGFPDDFTLTGTFAQRWERLGRAVAPPMYRAVGERLAEWLSDE